MTTRRTWCLAAAGWAAVIVVSGVAPTRDAVAAVSSGFDELATAAGHFAAYVVLGYLLSAAFESLTGRVRAAALTLALGAMLGGAIELVQAPLPYRDAQLSDFVVDAAGVAVGIAVFTCAGLARRRRPRPG